MRTVLLALVLISFATPALASDGVLEINQTCAVQTGCFSGDTAGYPVTIDGSAGRSYRLTSDLTGIGANSDGIFLNISRITLDFNGFSLAGFSIGSGTGNGITGGGVGGAVAGFATIKNGVIRGFRARGVALGGANGVRIENITFEFNRGGGVQVGDVARVVESVFSGNGGVFSDGLVAGAGSLIGQNVVAESGGNGIFTGTGSTVSGNTANDSGRDGIRAGDGSTVSGNTAYQNGEDGIDTTLGCTISGNTAYQNGGDGIKASLGSTVSGNTAYQNGEDGIQANSGSTVQRNTVRSNGNFGLLLGSNAAYRENVVSGNTMGAVSSGIDAGANVINGVVTPTP